MITTTFDPDRPLRYVRYGRMSGEEQNPRSPDQQFDEIDRTKRKHGRDNWVHVKTFRDNAISGRFLSRRPEFRQMCDEIRSGRLDVDLILVDTIERFARLDDLPAIREELRKKHGVLVLTADTGFTDPTSAVGQIYGAVEAIRASSAAAQKAHDVLRGKIDVVMMKRWPGGPPPCGYQLEARTETIRRQNGKKIETTYRVLVPDPATADIPKRVYELAHDNGWGRIQIARELNSDPDFVAKHGKVNESLVGSIMTNTIYKGVCRYNYLATDIEDDRRIIRKKDPIDVIYVEEFCEGIVQTHIVDKVHADAQSRSEAVLKMRATKEQADGKQIQPVAPGLILVYPMTGLVRCADCGAAMSPSKSGAKSKKSTSYYYYRCPCAKDDRCSNKLYLRGPWLWDTVITQLRDVVPALSVDDPSSCPAWLAALISEVRIDLIQQLDQDQERRPILVEELKEIKSKVAGWTETLSKSDLPTLVRNQVEDQLSVVLQRKQMIEVEEEMLTSGAKHVDNVLDPQVAMGRLRRLDEVLAGSHASDINVELSKHIESILVQSDGTVAIRINRLGIFEGASEILADNTTDVSVFDEADDEGSGFRIRSRALPRRRTTGPGKTSTLAKPDGLIEKPASVSNDWVDEARFRMPELKSWKEEYAEEVFHRRQEAQLSYAKLAAEFGVTRPTARAAVEHYLETHPEASDEVDLPRGGQRPAKFDLSSFGHEARKLWEANWSKLKLAEKYGCSAPTIDKALAWSYKQEGKSVPTREEQKEQRVAKARAMLDEGHSLDEIAETLAVSEVTARTYLKSSFDAEGKAMPDLRSKPHRPQ